MSGLKLSTCENYISKPFWKRVTASQLKEGVIYLHNNIWSPRLINEIDDEGYVYYHYYNVFNFKLCPQEQVCKKENFVSACSFEATEEETKFLEERMNNYLKEKFR